MLQQLDTRTISGYKNYTYMCDNRVIPVRLYTVMENLGFTCLTDLAFSEETYETLTSIPNCSDTTMRQLNEILCVMGLPMICKTKG